MKRIILTVSFIMATCICMWADPISKQQAQQKAESFWLNLKAADPSHPHRIVSQTPSLTDANPETSAYYIFNIGEADGLSSRATTGQKRFSAMPKLVLSPWTRHQRT